VAVKMVCVALASVMASRLQYVTIQPLTVLKDFAGLTFVKPCSTSS